MVLWCFPLSRSDLSFPNEAELIQPCADEAKVVQPLAYDHGCTLTGRFRVHADGQCRLPPLSMCPGACSAVQAYNMTSTCCRQCCCKRSHGCHGDAAALAAARKCRRKCSASCDGRKAKLERPPGRGLQGGLLVLQQNESKSRCAMHCMRTRVVRDASICFGVTWWWLSSGGHVCSAE